MQESNNNQPYIDEGQEIDIMEMIARLWKNRAMIIKWCIAGAVIGLVVGFSIPKTYKASVTFAPETQQKMGSGVSSIASMMGINLNNNVDAISTDLYPDVVHSTPFIFELLQLEVQFERKDSTITTSLLDYMCEYQRSPWWSAVFRFPFKILNLITSDKDIEMDSVLDPMNLPEKERKIVRFFSKNISVHLDKKTSKVSMSIELQDRMVAADVMNAIVSNLQTFMSEYRTSKARQDVENLSLICEDRKDDYYKAQKEYAKYLDANKNVIRESANAERDRLQQEMNLAYQVYSQVATQLEASRIQEQQAKPVMVIIDPVTVPLRRSAPSKAKLLILYTFLAGCVSSAWVLFGRNCWKDFKNKL